MAAWAGAITAVLTFLIQILTRLQDDQRKRANTYDEKIQAARKALAENDSSAAAAALADQHTRVLKILGGGQRR